VTTALVCPSCGAELSTPLVCEACGALLDPSTPPSPFETLGLAPAYALDLSAARRRLLALSRAAHPDFHANANEETRQRAEDNTAALNAAFRILSDDARRAAWLVRSLGGPGEDEERAMPAAFLHEVLEWNEAIETARGAEPDSPARAEIDPLATRLESERSESMRRIASALDPLPATGSPLLRDVRKELNAVRYLDRALREIRELRLSNPSRG
jgi:molecular chaperone HscB